MVANLGRGHCSRVVGRKPHARADDEFDILPSVLDRLLDDEPGVDRESFSGRFFSLRDLTQAVARDLEALLNTRQEALEELPPEFAEVGHSLRTYGLPDFLH